MWQLVQTEMPCLGYSSEKSLMVDFLIKNASFLRREEARASVQA